MQIQLKRPENNDNIKFNEDQNESDSRYGLKGFVSELFGKTWIRYTLFFIICAVAVNFWIFRYDDYKNNCHVKIRMSLLEWNNLKIKEAIRFLKDKSPADYKIFCQYVDTISPDLPCGGSGGGCFRSEYNKQIEISILGHSNKPEYTAAMIVHETCHSIQNAEKRPLNEAECYGEMNRMLGDLGIDSPWKDHK